MAVLERELDGAWYKDRSADLSKVSVPVLSAANWGGQGLHPRGNFEGFMNSSSKHKWLEVHGGSHWAPFYTDYGVSLQKRFFNHFLKGEKNDWDKQPPVQLLVRHPGEKFEQRFENEWPIARTQWTSCYLNGPDLSLSMVKVGDSASVAYDTMGEGLTFTLPPQQTAAEITGPIALKVFASSSTSDIDFFAIVRVFDPSNKEVTFHGALDPHTPIAQGWLRGSHRKLDTQKTLPYRPYHTHDEKQPLEPNQIYEFDIEVWPSCIVVPPGYRIALTIRGKDYEHDGEAATLSNMKNPMKGCGPFVHDDETDRPPAIFNGKVKLYTGKDHPSALLLPIIPAK